MNSNVEFKRTHEGKLEMFVSGVPALGARVLNVQPVDGELNAFVAVPLKDATIGEVTTVIPFRSAA